ncbi:MAG TPA: isochorismatase family protein [Planctomycetaceae bacterium]|nr:isochorismatase family protein [Planctomycetaceae bacterium]
MRPFLPASILLCGFLMLTSSLLSAADFSLQLRSIPADPFSKTPGTREVRNETWPASKTAVIVCDVWDLHHCRNAVRRLEEFGPRLNAVLIEARKRGATIIHSPSDCMPAYTDHPARLRAIAAPRSADLPKDIAAWCSRIPAEEQAHYPIDQSDGGEDDDPAEHAQWAARLKSLGRNPGMPWQRQSDMIAIDPERDFLSDKGDEVWNILQSRGIDHVILTGVHTNMCVLGRPFGLRQMARNGKHVVLMRDMTDCMYNPQRWPYVDHFTGCDLIIAHVERFVCPTVTSDQILGGQPFRSKSDKRTEADVIHLSEAKTDGDHWRPISLPAERKFSGPAWYRATIRVPQRWLTGSGLVVVLPAAGVKVWWNGASLEAESKGEIVRYQIPAEALTVDDANLLVLRVEGGHLAAAPVLQSGDRQFNLSGRWQFRQGDDSSWSNMPLPAKFGTPTDIVFEPQR